MVVVGWQEKGEEIEICTSYVWDETGQPSVADWQATAAGFCDITIGGLTNADLFEFPSITLFFLLLPEDGPPLLSVHYSSGKDLLSEK